MIGAKTAGGGWREQGRGFRSRVAIRRARAEGRAAVVLAASVVHADPRIVGEPAPAGVQNPAGSTARWERAWSRTGCRMPGASTWQAGMRPKGAQPALRLRGRFAAQAGCCLRQKPAYMIVFALRPAPARMPARDRRGRPACERSEPAGTGGGLATQRRLRPSAKAGLHHLERPWLFGPAAGQSISTGSTSIDHRTFRASGACSSQGRRMDSAVCRGPRVAACSARWAR